MKKKKLCFRTRDVAIIFNLVCLFFIILSMTSFLLYLFNKEYPKIDFIKIANTLNIAITMIGIAEGVRSFNKTANSEVGTSSPVPAYKISFLITFMIHFALIATLALMMETFCKNNLIENKTPPDFAGDNLIECVLSNFLVYIVAKYGNKIAIDVDLSTLTFFKKK